MRKACYRIFVVVGLLLSFTNAAVAQVVYNGHTYQLTSSVSSWSVAEASAVSLGGHLVAITDAAEQTFIQNTFLTAPASTAVPCWIGLQRSTQPNGPFTTWSTGEALGFTNWNPGEPNNNGGNEGYAAINWHFARGEGAQFLGNWNDVPLNGTLGFGGNTDGPYFGIVEIAPVPEPGGVLLVGAAALAGCRVIRRKSCRTSSCT